MWSRRGPPICTPICWRLWKYRKAAWESPTQLYAIAYRPIPLQKQQSIEAWPETLTLGHPLPMLPLWLRLDLCLPLQLEETYADTCSGLRIPG